MDIIKLKELIDKKLDQRKIAVELNCSQSTVKYWLKRYNLKTINTRKYEHIKVDENEKYCPKCETIKLKSEFYKKKLNSEVLQSYCKECNHEDVKKRVKNIKLKMLDYKGNQCVDCKLHLNETKACDFDFHHLNPKEKDVNFEIIRWKDWETITKELDKCVILCSNCHRIRHSDE